MLLEEFSAQHHVWSCVDDPRRGCTVKTLLSKLNLLKGSGLTYIPFLSYNLGICSPALVTYLTRRLLGDLCWPFSTLVIITVISLRKRIILFCETDWWDPVYTACRTWRNWYSHFWFCAEYICIYSGESCRTACPPIPLSNCTMFLSCGEQRSVGMLFRQLRSMPCNHSITPKTNVVSFQCVPQHKELFSSTSRIHASSLSLHYPTLYLALCCVNVCFIREMCALLL